jgi:membrane protease YdiL (CAAX protease family)
MQTAPFLRLSIGVAWSIGYFAVCFPFIAFAALGGQFVGRHTWPWISPLFHGIFWIAGILFVTWLFRVRVNRASWDGMALPKPQVKRLVVGSIAGCAAILLAGAFEYELGWLHVAHIDFAPHLGTPKIVWALAALVPSLAVGVTEELAFRGYIFQTLAERSRVWIAAGLMAVLFAAFHFSLSGFDAGFVLSVLILSLLYVVLRFTTGSLWFGIGFHGAWDWTQTYAIGLSTIGMTRYNPAIVQIRQTGPSLWVGSGVAIEGGLLFLIISAIVLGIALLHGSRSGRTPPWTAQLATNGKPVSD